MGPERADEPLLSDSSDVIFPPYYPDDSISRSGEWPDLSPMPCGMGICSGGDHRATSKKMTL